MTASPLIPVRQAATPTESGILRRSARPKTVLVFAVVVVVVITVIGFLLKSHPIDLRLAQDLNLLHTGKVAVLTNLVYHLFSPVPAILITMVITAVIWAVTRQLRVAAAFAGVVAITWIPSDVVKMLVHRTRPDVKLMTHPFSPVQPDASYPSGHEVFITALVIALIFLLMDTRWSPIVAPAGVLLVFVVACSLMIDAVHYPTDVIVSIAWSVAVAPAARLVWVDWLMPRIPVLNGRPARR